jgi:transcriptional regulator with XRE-family HTH domain
MTTYRENPIKAIREAAGLSQEEMEEAVSKMLDERNGKKYDASRTRFIGHLERWPREQTHGNIRDCLDAAGLHLLVKIEKV